MISDKIKMQIKIMYISDGGDCVSTSSITKNYSFTGEAAVRFAEAIVEALDKPKREITVNCRELHTQEEVAELMRKWRETNARQ